MKVKITEKLKHTLTHNGRFLTLSLIITMLDKCFKLLIEYGISQETMSFLVCGYDKIAQELKEGYKYVKDKEEFNKIVGQLKKNNK